MIQSFSDIITNWSSEIFMIKTKLDLEDFTEAWKEILREYCCWYKEDAEDREFYIDNDDILGYISETRNGIEINFPVICNVTSEAREELERQFGKKCTI